MAELGGWALDNRKFVMHWRFRCQKPCFLEDYPCISAVLYQPNPENVRGFPGGSVSKESVCNAGDLGLIPELGKSSGGEHGNPLQYSCLENSHEWRSLAGCSPWGHKELDMTK